MFNCNVPALWSSLMCHSASSSFLAFHFSPAPSVGMGGLDWAKATGWTCLVSRSGCVDPGFVREIHGMAVRASDYAFDECWCPHLILSSARLVSVFNWETSA